MRFGERLKQARTKIGKTQEEVAAYLHVSRQTISSWENERSYPDISSLLNLSDYYGLSLDVLLKEDSGMVEEMKRKEQESKLKKMWSLSYIMNISFLIIIILGSVFKWSPFQLGLGAQIMVTAILLLNVGLLSLLTNERQLLKGKPSSFIVQSHRFKRILVVEGIALFIIGGLTISHVLPTYTLFGVICGIVSASIFAYVILTVTVKNQKNNR